MSAPEIVIPPRDWGDDEAAPVEATVIVSSRDGHGDPGADLVGNRRAAWRGLARRAAGAGWAVRVTYALAHLPDQFYGNGNLQKAAHYVHTVAVRLARRGSRAAAVWRREYVAATIPPDEWSCDMAMVDGRHMGLREFTATVLP